MVLWAISGFIGLMEKNIEHDSYHSGLGRAVSKP